MKRLNIDEAVEALKKGQLVVVPTETVYGLAADGLNEKAIRKLYSIKGRPKNKPVMLQISNQHMLSDICVFVPAEAKIIMQSFWPGPVSLVLKKVPEVSGLLSAGTDTIGIRMPDHQITLEIINKIGRPLAVPSANISGRKSLCSAEEVEEQLEGLEIAGIVDGGTCRLGLESTIVDLTGAKPEILREGAIPEKEILDLLGL